MHIDIELLFTDKLVKEITSCVVRSKDDNVIMSINGECRVDDKYYNCVVTCLDIQSRTINFNIAMGDHSIIVRKYSIPQKQVGGSSKSKKHKKQYGGDDLVICE